VSKLCSWYKAVKCQFKSASAVLESVSSILAIQGDRLSVSTNSVVTPVPIVTAKPAGDSIARAKDVPSASAGPEILAAPELAVLHALPDCHLPVHTRVVVEWTPSATFWVVKARSSRSLCNGPKTVSFQTLSTSTNRVEALIHADSSYLVMCVKCWKE